MNPVASNTKYNTVDIIAAMISQLPNDERQNLSNVLKSMGISMALGSSLKETYVPDEDREFDRLTIELLNQQNASL